MWETGSRRPECTASRLDAARSSSCSATAHEHYRVRWDEQHESILYSADGIIITPQHARPARRASR